MTIALTEDRIAEMPDFGWGDRIGYLAAHQRVWVWRGKASSHQCRCGRRAQQWAFRDRPDALEDVREWNGRLRVVRYSSDPRDYDPMCRSCHVKLDRAREAR